VGAVVALGIGPRIVGAGLAADRDLLRHSLLLCEMGRAKWNAPPAGAPAVQERSSREGRRESLLFPRSDRASASRKRSVLGLFQNLRERAQVGRL